ncbi:MAG TPA: hypothetical protein VHM91_18255 [Verrucomicrobiales bacterium]|nr:hypothetical protein [Verrucomicrobiales bacterium]
MKPLCVPPGFLLQCRFLLRRNGRFFVSLVALAALAPVPLRATDADGDGIPADWEVLRGSSDSDPSDAAMDWDGDGLSLYLEYLTQGRPWGNYTLRRLPFASLPMDMPASGITASEVAAVNRAGEVVVNFTDTSGVRAFLWTPPGGPLSATELVEVPFSGAGPLFFNDAGEVLIPSTGSADIRNLRDTEIPDVTVTWPDGSTSAALALSNGQQVLVRTTYAASTPFVSPADRYQWYDAAGTSSGTAEFHYDPSSHIYASGAAADTSGGAWLWGYSRDSVSPFAAMDEMSARLPVDDAASPVSLASGIHGAAFDSAAGSFAAGTVWNDTLSLYQSVRLSSDGLTVIEGAVPGVEPALVGVAEDGMVAGWNDDVSPAQSFLWKDGAVKMENARLEVAAGISITGLSPAGVLYGLDYGVSAPLPPQPVVFQPAAPLLHDGAADEGAALTDSDGDGIPDVREAAAGTNSALADSDGDGIADLFELLAGTNPAAAPVTSAPGSTGLSVHTPARHPLQRVVLEP